MPPLPEEPAEKSSLSSGDRTVVNHNVPQPDDSKATPGSPISSRDLGTDGDSIGFFLPTDPAFERPGDTIGFYTLVRELGHGGFGTVWLADQSAPVKRRVALKILKVGMDTRQVVARFEQERQALAMMEHPHIARVLDAGVTSSGRPYFVMDLVVGEPMSIYCDRHRLTIVDRLRIFEQAAMAVQHAHGKGIIHRDLKPSNVLVGTVDGKAHATVIDFGIAKATSTKLTDKTLETAAEQVIGTLVYMSPEQAAGSLDIDTRTDVYALGVILYELLTGTTPVDRRSMGSFAFGGLAQMVRDVDTPPPSSRIRDSRDAITEIAENRGTDAKRLATIVRGELDWIVMKAVEKDRSRRYATASELATDVRRFIHGEPVSAAPPSAAYRIKKFVRRHRVAVGAGTAATLALIVGIFAFAHIAEIAAEERDRALAAQRSEATQRKIADVARESAERHAETAKAERAEAERQRSIAEATARAEAHERKRAIAINHFVTDALRASDPHRGGSQGILVTEAMQNAVNDLDGGAFLGEPDIEASLRSIIAEIFLRNGKVREALPLAERALELYDSIREDDDKVAAALNLAATVSQELGDLDKAEPLFARSVAIQRKLHPKGHEELAAAMNNLALIHHSRGRSADAEPLIAEALEMRQAIYSEENAILAMSMNNLAVVRDALGKKKEAEELYEKSLAIYRRIFKEHPELAMALLNTGQMRIDQSRLPEAEDLLKESVAMYRTIFRGDHPDTARAISALANVKVLRGDEAEAERLGKESLEMTRRLFRGRHPLVADRLVALARIYREIDRPADAEPLHREALEMRRFVFKGDHPAIARSLDELAATLRDLGRFTDAEPYFGEALSMVERLDKAPSDRRVVAMNRLAEVRRRMGKAGEAEELSRRAFEMSRALHRDRPSPAESAARSSLARNLKELGRNDEAAAILEGSIEILEAVYGPDHLDVAFAYENLGKTRLAAKSSASAVAAFEKSIAIHRRLSPEGSHDMALTLTASAGALALSGEKVKALAQLEEALAILAKKFPPDHRDIVEAKRKLEEIR